MVQYPGCSLESPGGLLKFLMPTPHPRLQLQTLDAARASHFLNTPQGLQRVAKVENYCPYSDSVIGLWGGDPSWILLLRGTHFENHLPSVLVNCLPAVTSYEFMSLW